MNLLDFSQKSVSSDTFPLTILWPASAPVAVLGDQWTRRPGGLIEAVYQDADELRLALTITQWIREPKPTRQQSTLLPVGENYYTQ